MAKTVLLADDSTTIQRVVQLALAGEDLTVVSVADGEQAIDTIRHSAPDLVVADIGMPRPGGYEVTEWIRSQPDLSGIPVLLMAGAFEPADLDRARTVGADGVLTKPLEPTAFVRRVTDLLSSGRPRPDHADASVQESPAPPRADHAVQAVDSAGPPAITPAEPGPGADRYFDELDRAFAQLARSPRLPRPAAEGEEPTGPFDVAPYPGPPPVAAPTGAPLGDAFATLLDAEQTGAVVLPLGRIAMAPAAAPSIDVNALADQIARRVLAQLSDRVVRDSVNEVVSATAERLVREEIERIKRNIT